VVTGITGLSPFVPLSNVTPFTYRDGATYLETLEELRRKFNELVAFLNSLNGVIGDIYEEIADVRGEIVASEKRQIDALNALRTELLGLIEDSSASGLAHDPTSGQLRSVDDVLSRVYDYTRVHARFAADMDARSLTAAQLDALQERARHADLAPLGETISDIYPNS
jgi:hypothetical protein